MSTQSSSSIPARFSNWRPIAGVFRTIAFWGAITLPLAFVPLLYGGVGGRQLLAFFALAILNVVCLIVGHDHRPRG